MYASGFASAPISQSLVIILSVLSILTSLTETSHYFSISPEKYVWQLNQVWKIFTWQLSFSSLTELIFASWTLYNLRVIERLWGSRKYFSFVIITYLVTSICVPLLPIKYLPSGSTAIVFALLAQYQALVPYNYRYEISKVHISSKIWSYLIPAQLAISQYPHFLPLAAFGFLYGVLSRYVM